VGWIVGEVVALNISIEDVNTTRMEKYLSKSVPIWGEALGNWPRQGHRRKPYGLEARQPDILVGDLVGDAGPNGHWRPRKSIVSKPADTAISPIGRAIADSDEAARPKRDDCALGLGLQTWTLPEIRTC
jgi:hypothetical protein